MRPKGTGRKRRVSGSFQSFVKLVNGSKDVDGLRRSVYSFSGVRVVEKSS